ncbi:MAG: phosphoribosylformylglycinamidine cyclo-ligase [Deltaproteobacteria bacterium]|jgi:phosphoribosylformylglycinamidine cyclo-ligase|nr:phosphoribosylformylglycinamidine cyclo-ligase [Deltaproteobacteria bacterium]MBW2480129.1 phosphoribosylformylglycinamidine cyclo-ligase [Deltaproteobacteria bacterium]
MSDSLTYADAGVDIDKANKLVSTISEIAKQTTRSGVIGEIGGFGGLFSLNLANLDRPVLVSSTDGVGTKLKIAFMLDKHDTVGIDLVAMCVNDIIVQGAKPLFFLDYLSMGKLDSEQVAEIIKGIGEGCRQANCALLGGETAEMPGFYQDNEYDMAGFAVGIVDNSKIIDGTEVRVGHRLIGIASSGLHSNGYSLVRKICFDRLKLKIDDYVPDLGQTIGEALLTPTKIYVDPLLSIMKDLPVHGLAHITGGGIEDNILRIIPQACHISIQGEIWDVPPIFSFLQQAGNVSDAEMRRTFNNGIGMIAVVPAEATDDVLQRLDAMNEKAYLIGEIMECKDSSQRITWE